VVSLPAKTCGSLKTLILKTGETDPEPQAFCAATLSWAMPLKVGDQFTTTVVFEPIIVPALEGVNVHWYDWALPAGATL